MVDEHLALCDRVAPGEYGRYLRSLLLAVSASLHEASGDSARAVDHLALMWDTAGRNATDVVRRTWRLIESLLWNALEAGALDPP